MIELTLQIEREEDGRWIAELMQVPGAITYGETSFEAALGALQVGMSEAMRPVMLEEAAKAMRKEFYPHDENFTVGITTDGLIVYTRHKENFTTLPDYRGFKVDVKYLGGF